MKIKELEELINGWTDIYITYLNADELEEENEHDYYKTHADEIAFCIPKLKIEKIMPYKGGLLLRISEEDFKENETLGMLMEGVED